jgi:hypothetical protein
MLRMMFALLFVGFAFVCEAAPAPLPKQIPQTTDKDICGVWLWNYKDQKPSFTVHLNPDGSSRSFDMGVGDRPNHYTGTWTFKDGVLRVEEKADIGGSPWSSGDYKITVHRKGRKITKMTADHLSWKMTKVSDR